MTSELLCILLANLFVIVIDQIYCVLANFTIDDTNLISSADFRLNAARILSSNNYGSNPGTLYPVHESWKLIHTLPAPVGTFNS